VVVLDCLDGVFAGLDAAAVTVFEHRPVAGQAIAARADADVKRVRDAVVAAFAEPAVKETMAKQGNTIAISTSEFAQSYFRSEKEKYATLVKKAGIELQ
jgi:tripartite-type tricarboxylate transporter receptor subunit TctC